MFMLRPYSKSRFLNKKINKFKNYFKGSSLIHVNLALARHELFDSPTYFENKNIKAQYRLKFGSQSENYRITVSQMQTLLEEN